MDRHLIMELLRDGPRTGQQLVDASDEKLGRSTVYVELERMDAAGLVTSKEVPRNIPEELLERFPGMITTVRLFELTEQGRRVYDLSKSLVLKALWATLQEQSDVLVRTIGAGDLLRLRGRWFARGLVLEVRGGDAHGRAEQKRSKEAP